MNIYTCLEYQDIIRVIYYRAFHVPPSRYARSVPYKIFILVIHFSKLSFITTRMEYFWWILYCNRNLFNVVRIPGQIFNPRIGLKNEQKSLVV